MIGFYLYLCVLGIVTLIWLFIFCWKIKPKSIKEWISNIGYSIVLAIIPAVFFAWVARAILPNVQEIGDNRDSSNLKYKLLKDTYSGESLSFCTNYVTNISDQNIYIIRVFYTKNPYAERQPSKLIAKIPPKTTIEHEYYIRTIFPKFISNTETAINRGRRGAKSYTQLEQEVMIVSEETYLEELEVEY